MSDSQDKSDDLIAELAKLMASGAAGGESAPKPTVIKLPPLDEATVKSAPVRIPGMDSSASGESASRGGPSSPSSSAGSAPVRIPGMDRPSGVSDSPTAPAPRPASQFELGKSEAQGAPASAEAPREPGKPAAPHSTASQSTSGLRIEPVRLGPTPLSSAPKPAPQPVRDEPRREAAADAGTHGQGGHPAADEPEDDDPIADLIAQELDRHDDSDADDDTEELPRPPVAPAPVQPKAQPEQPAVVQMNPTIVSPRQPAGDRFDVSPEFAQSERRVPPASHQASVAAPQSHDSDETDPMDEIESLIGEAVRVELNPHERTAEPVQATPVVPPLNTGFTPRRAGLREQEPQIDSAEAAIMAAASASDDDEDDIDEPTAEERPYKRMRVKPPRTSGIPGGMRQYVGIAVAGTLLLASGFGLYWVLGMNRDDPADAPLLTADAAPAKVEPVTPVTTSEPASGSVVFDEIDGVADAGAPDETLVSRDETAGETPAEVARVVTPTVEDDGDTVVAESGLANRKVRTVTVRPDGTIVASDDSVAGTSELPVDRPNVPEIEGAEAPSDLLTAAVADTRTPEEGGSAADPLSSLVADTADGADEPFTPDPIDVAALDASEDSPAVFDGSLVAPVPMPRPFNRTAMVGSGGTNTLVAPVVTAPAPASGGNAPASTPLTALTQQNDTPAPVSSAGSGSRTYVQLSSQRTEADANASLRAVQSRLGSLLSSPLEVRRVDLGAKGIWYRVVMPTGSFQDATQSCARIKANGGDCVAING